MTGDSNRSDKAWIIGTIVTVVGGIITTMLAVGKDYFFPTSLPKADITEQHIQDLPKNPGTTIKATEDVITIPFLGIWVPNGEAPTDYISKIVIQKIEGFPNKVRIGMEKADKYNWLENGKYVDKHIGTQTVEINENMIKLSLKPGFGVDYFPELSIRYDDVLDVHMKQVDHNTNKPADYHEFFKRANK